MRRVAGIPLGAFWSVMMGSAIPNVQSGSQVAVNWSDGANAALSVVYILCNTQ